MATNRIATNKIATNSSYRTWYETGWRVSGNNHWLWSFSNEDAFIFTPLCAWHVVSLGGEQCKL